ncbi:hypothetical protein R9C00_24010 [Flammeovirgaceae bacterium SG7u.111]|nr:hypothetical protein [Flammeovirgaceae bacterium SG7u.132]WPO34768.1 hypothetical protein R9C00_24010 [Flammeovirgaceae bacterium SG7u.111]
MSEVSTNDRIEKACVNARDKFEKLGEDFSEVKGKLDWVLGSYANDGNPEGLYEVGGIALSSLTAYKKQKPRQVSKKLIEDLEKALKEQ